MDDVLQIAFDNTTLSSRILRATQTPLTHLDKKFMKQVEFTTKLLKAVIPLAIIELENYKQAAEEYNNIVGEVYDH